MDNLYLVCALAGGTLLVWQVLMSLVGLGGAHGMDVDHDAGFDHDMGHEIGHEVGHGAGHGASLFVGILTLRTVAAALTFFGLTGLAATAFRPEEPGLSLGLALVAGLGAMLLVATLMKMLYRLKADGTARINRAVGQPGTVYLRIPAHKQGAGKVTVQQQNRTMEYLAVTAGEELPTGARVVVVAVAGPGTLEVASAVRSETTTTM